MAAGQGQLLGNTTGLPNHSTAQSYGMCFNMIYSNSEVCVCVCARVHHSYIDVFMDFDGCIYSCISAFYIYTHADMLHHI